VPVDGERGPDEGARGGAVSDDSGSLGMGSGRPARPRRGLRAAICLRGRARWRGHVGDFRIATVPPRPLEGAVLPLDRRENGSFLATSFFMDREGAVRWASDGAIVVNSAYTENAARATVQRRRDTGRDSARSRVRSQDHAIEPRVECGRRAVLLSRIAGANRGGSVAAVGVSLRHAQGCNRVCLGGEAFDVNLAPDL
jgi:hypothetical protein